MSFNFDNYVQQGQEFVNKVAAATGIPDDKARAARIVTAVFHALRDRISPAESLHLISQLPMFLKAVYVDGWKLAKCKKDIDTLEEFLDAVRANLHRAAAKDLGNNEMASKIIRQVISVIREYTDQGELDDIRAQLPDAIGDLFKRTIAL